jgi:hypothetical protein
MTVYTLDPLRDPRWADLIARHPHASVFHTPAWLATLRRTYGYEPMAFTTAAAGTDLEDGLVVCKVRSWLTGRRLVSLPFSDHCEPLVQSGTAFEAIGAHLDRVRRDEGWGYIELRPHTPLPCPTGGISAADRFWYHVLDLQPGIDALFAACHRDSVQRKIRRAVREQLTYHEGSGETVLREFYRLLLLTRLRHQLPPQPLGWFRNLAAAFGGAMKIRVARHDGRAIAAIVTLRHRDTMVYKYGASDARHHALGGMHLLFWKTIEEAHGTGCAVLDLGRCDTDNPGLALFKERWGATRSEMTYWRYMAKPSSSAALRKYAIHGVQQALGHAPGVCRIAAGRLLYRHAG